MDNFNASLVLKRVEIADVKASAVARKFFNEVQLNCRPEIFNVYRFALLPLVGRQPAPVRT